MDENKRCKVYPGIILLLLLTGISALLARDISGSWISSADEIKITFHDNGTFIFSTANENRAGNYELVKTKLILVDTRGRSYAYTLGPSKAGKLVLIDKQGKQIICQRTDVNRRKVKPDGVLAEVGSNKLLEDHVDIGLLVMRFVTGQKLQAVERDNFTRASIHEFGKAPVKFLQQVEALRTSLKNVARLENPLDVGNSRQQLLSGFYTATRHLPERDQPLMVAIVNRYVKMLAYDEEESLMLTDQDVNALLNYMEFVDQLSSNVVKPLTTEKRRDFAESLVHNFVHLDPQQKRFLCAASVAWSVVDFNWRNFSKLQRQKMQQSYTASKSARARTARHANDSVPASMTGYVQMYRNMTSLAKSDHAAIISAIIENSGTASYWKTRSQQ